MKINRMAEEQKSPSWAFVDKIDDKFAKELLDNGDMKRIASMSENLSEEGLVEERDIIEKCASENKPYLYNINWPSEVKGQLKEYAIACNLVSEDFRGISPTIYVDKYVVASSDSKKMVKTASLQLHDAFKIDEKLSEIEKRSDWQKVTKESRLSDRPALKGGSVIAARGGDDYFANSEVKAKKGQNSILDPDAIKRELESKDKDPGQKLREDRANWEKERVKEISAQAKQLIPQKKVFATESLNVQSGIKGEPFDYSSLPEKTDGEKLREVKAEEKKNISREEKSKHEFRIQTANTFNISSELTDGLKKFLK